MCHIQSLIATTYILPWQWAGQIIHKIVPEQSSAAVLFCLCFLMFTWNCFTCSTVWHKKSDWQWMKGRKKLHVVKTASAENTTKPLHFISIPFTHVFTLWVLSLLSLPSDSNKLNLLNWTLDQFSFQTTCPPAKLSPAFWLFLLMSGLVTAGFSVQILLNTKTCLQRQIFIMLSDELARNSSCSVKPIAQYDSLHFLVLSYICLPWTTRLFGLLEGVGDIVK